MAGTRQVSIRVQTEGKAEVQRDFADVGKAGASAQDQIAAASDKASAAADRQMEKWRKMAAAAKESEAVAARQASFNSVLGVGGGSGKSAEDSASVFGGGSNDNGQMSRVQSMMLQSAGFRTFESLSSGMPLSRIALQQGGEVAAAFGMGEGGLGGALQGLTKLINPVTVGLGLITTAVVSGAAAALAYQQNLDKLEVTATNLGATAGMTGQDIEDLAESSAKLGDVSVSSARDMATSYLSTGRIGGDVTAKLIALTRDYAVATGQDAKKATAELGKAFADPAKGADELNGKLNFLDDTTYRYIQNLVEQNRVTEAQAALADALGAKLLGSAGKLDVLGEAAHRVAGFFSDMFNWYGKLVDRMASGGTMSERIAALQKMRNAITPAEVAGGGQWAKNAADLDAQISDLTKKWTAANTLPNTVGNQIASDARAAMATVDTLSKKLGELQTNRAKIAAGLSSGQLTGSDVAAAGKDLKSLDADIAAVKAGYSSAAAQAAAFKHSQSEAAQAARKAAEEARKAAADAKKAADQLDKQEEIHAKNLLQQAKLSGDTSGVAQAEEGLRIVQLTKQYEEAGIKTAEARALAEREVGKEYAAQQLGIVKIMQAEASTLVTTDQMNQRFAEASKHFGQDQEALETFNAAGIKTFDTFANSLEIGQQGWKDWGAAAKSAIVSVLDEFEKLAVINPLENALFGNVSGYSKLPSISNVGGFFSSLFGGGSGGGGNPLSLPESLFGHNANGTDNWRGGLTWVGEKGKELVNLPSGSQVFSNAQSMAMGGGQQTFNIHFHGEGAVLADTVKAWVQAGTEQAIARANANVPGLVNDSIQRRLVRA